jgi:hypothetical protein
MSFNRAILKLNYMLMTIVSLITKGYRIILAVVVFKFDEEVYPNRNHLLVVHSSDSNIA